VKIKILELDEVRASMVVAFYPDDVALDERGAPAWSTTLNFNIPTTRAGVPLGGDELMAWIAAHRPAAEVAAEAKRRSGTLDLSGVKAMVGRERRVDDVTPTVANGVAEPSLEESVQVL
jgi:hypothetical protein